MRTKLQLVFYLSAFFLLFTGSVQAQLNFSEDFETEEYGWSDDEGFYLVEDEVCAGGGAIRGNAYTSFFGANEPETISGSLGLSNGMPATLSFSYKLVNYGFDPPLTALEGDFGMVTIEYSFSPLGPWTQIESIDSGNHTSSPDCATRTSTFTPPAGTQVYLRFFATAGETEADYFFFIDDVAVTQGAAPACTGTPAASAATTTASGAVCTNQEFSLTLTPAYAQSGLTYQWQASLDNITYSNIAASNSLLFTTTQPVSSWYRAVITCAGGGDPVTSAPVQVLSNGQLCYCDIVFDYGVEPITSVTIGTLNNTSPPDTDEAPAMEDFTGLPQPVLAQGMDYPVQLEGNTDESTGRFFTIFFDWNHNGELTDDGEIYQIGEFEEPSTGDDGLIISGEITVPATALVGPTRMRVVKMAYDPAEEACGEFFSYGQVEDYMVNVQPAVGCTVAPEVSTIVPESTTVCLNTTSELSLSTNYILGGISYQWQSSADNVTYANITGATQKKYTVSQAATTWYRAFITCSAGNLTTTTAAVQIATNPILCYCEIDFGTPAPITQVTFGSINNLTAADADGSLGYEDYTATLPAADVVKGVSYTMTVQGNTGSFFSGANVVAYIDFNNNGSFTDAGEDIEIGYLEPSTGDDDIVIEAEILIPATAITGVVRMRVVKMYEYDDIVPCGSADDLYIGQAQDYLLNLLPQVPCTTAPAASTIEAEETLVCVNGPVMLSLSTQYTQSGISYQWQNSPDNVTYTNITGADDADYSGLQPSNTWYRAVITCSAGNLSVTTPGVLITTNPILCYCEPTFPQGVEPISFVNFATLNNTSSAESSETIELEDFTSLAPTSIMQGQSYEITLGGNTEGSWTNTFTVYFDWDKNGTLDNDGEDFLIGDITDTDGTDEAGYVSNTVIVPPNAPLGITRMRVVKRYNAEGPACNNEGYGQAEDYMVNVTVAAGTGSFDASSFKYYPNPVKDVMNISYISDISGVEVFNLLGQQVLVKTINSNAAQIDMAALAAGTYMVKVSTGNGVKTVKVIKQ